MSIVKNPNPKLKYFSYDLIAAGNDWIRQTRADEARALKKLARLTERYLVELDQLKSRIGLRGWQFFRHGYGPTGLHDGRLLSMTVGDGLNYTAEGKEPFRRNRQALIARLEFLNYEEEFYYVFELRGVTQVCSNIFPDDGSSKGIDDLYTYELVGIDDHDLQLGFLFASGATIIVQFHELRFRRRRINRT
jgi:hypothetical protein